MGNDDIEFELDDKGKGYIQVADDMRLALSARGWQLQQKMVAASDTKSQKKGDVKWSAFKFYMTLESALKDIVHIKTSKIFFNDATSLIQANNKVIKELVKVIKELVAAFSPEYTIIKS